MWTTSRIARLPAWDEAALNRHAGWLLLVLAAVMLLPGMAWLPLVDRDEPRFSQATVEMLARGDFVVPHFNGEYRFDKPPLTYWWMALNYTIFGQNEFGARLHSAVSAYGVALVIFAFGRRLFGVKPGLLAAAGWLTCIQVFQHGRLALADMPMILAVALTMWALYELLMAEEAPKRFGRWYWVLWLSQAVGFLAKGPIALAVPLLAVLLWRFAFYRRPLPWGRLQVLSGLPLALVPIAAWGLPALLQTHGLFWDVGMGEHVVKRGTTSFNARSIVPGYYLLTFFLSLFPWAAFVGLTWHRLRRNWNPANAFLLSWWLAAMLIFSFYATQLPHYTMPGYAAFFLVLAQPGTLPERRPVERVAFWTVWGLFALIALLLLSAGVFGLSRGIETMPEILYATLFGLGMAISGFCLLGLLVRRADHPPMLGVGGLALIALGAAMAGLTLNFSVATKQLEGLRDHPLTGQAVGWGYSEPGMVFYARRPWNFVNDENTDFAALLSDPGNQIIVARAREWRGDDDTLRAIWQQTTPPAWRDRRAQLEPLLVPAQMAGWQIARIEGFNYARASWVELLVFFRRDDQEALESPSVPSPADAANSR